MDQAAGRGLGRARGAAEQIDRLAHPRRLGQQHRHKVGAVEVGGQFLAGHLCGKFDADPVGQQNVGPGHGVGIGRIAATQVAAMRVHEERPAAARRQQMGDRLIRRRIDQIEFQRGQILRGQGGGRYCVGKI